jgi:hypothetical protein
VRPYRLPGQPRAPLAGVVAAPAALESPPPLLNARRGSPHRGSSSLGRHVHGRRHWGAGDCRTAPSRGLPRANLPKAVEAALLPPSPQGRRRDRRGEEDKIERRESRRERDVFIRWEPSPPPGCCGAGARLGAAARARAGGRDSRGRERVVDRDGRGFGIRWAHRGGVRSRSRWWWPGGACGCNLFLRDRQLL